MSGTLLKMGVKHMFASDKGKSSKKNGDSEIGPYHYLAHVRTDKRGKPVLERKRKDCKYFMECGIPEEDAMRLAKIKHRAMLMDGGGKVLGIPMPVGIGGAIGFIPVVGDAVDSSLAYLLIVRSARKISGGLPSMKHKQMMGNVTIDLIIGFVPVLGDVADIFYRCNTRNANMLEDILKGRVTALQKAEKEAKVHEYVNSAEVVPTQPAPLGSATSSSGSAHSRTKRQHVPEKPVRSKGRAWTSALGRSGSQDKRMPNGPVPTQRPIHHDGQDVRSQGGRFATNLDIRI